MKNLIWIPVVVVGISVIWHMLNKDGRASRAVENVVENVSLSLEENSLTQQPIIIRKSMLEQKERDNREWTASNINKHPDLYLKHCGKTLVHFQEQYDAAIIEVNTTVNLYRRELMDAQASITPLLGFLKEAKKALTNLNTRYPTKVGVFTYKDADSLKASVFATDEKIVELEKLAQMRREQLEQLQKTHSDLVKGRDRVKKELRGLDGRIAHAKAQNLSKAVDGLNARMNALLSSLDAAQGVDGAQPGIVNDQSSTPSIDDVFSRRGIK